MNIRRCRLLAFAVTLSLAMGFGQPGAVGQDVIGRDGVSGPIDDMINQIDDLSPQEVEKTDAAAERTREELLHGQEAFHRAVESIKVAFTYELDRKLEAPGESGLNLVPRNYSCKIIGAVKGAKQYQSVEDTTEAGPELGKISIVAFNGKVTQATTLSNREASIVPMRSPSHTALLEHYLHSIPMLLGPDYAAHRNTHSDYLPAALKHGEYEVRPKLERVDGFLCHVVSCRGLDTMWIDVDHGFCLRRRVRFSRGGTEPTCLKFVLCFQDYVDLGKGIWMPRSIDLHEFATHWAPPGQRGSLKAISRMRASEIVVNDVPDALFDLEFPPGTAVIDKTRNVYYFVPKDKSRLAEVIAKGAPIVNGVVTGFDKLERPIVDEIPVAGKRSWATILWVANLILVLILMVTVFARRRRIDAAN